MHVAVLVIVLPSDPAVYSHALCLLEPLCDLFPECSLVNVILVFAAPSAPLNLTQLETAACGRILRLLCHIDAIVTRLQVDDIVSERPLTGTMLAMTADLAHERIADFKVKRWAHELRVVHRKLVTVGEIKLLNFAVQVCAANFSPDDWGARAKRLPGHFCSGARQRRYLQWWGPLRHTFTEMWAFLATGSRLYPDLGRAGSRAALLGKG
jgi:hypothetical protein